VATRSEWQVGRAEAWSTGGMVAAKTPLAAEAGAAVLARGGNAVDAAVTTSLVAAVVEPWMNGIGGGGYMVIHRPGDDYASVVSYPMVAPSGATEDMFPLGGSEAGFFGWPAVVGNANVMGPRSVAVSGTVAGLALALERFGTISWAEAIAPAIAHAERGFPVTWHTTLKSAGDLALLNSHPETRALFTDDGLPWVTQDESAPTMIRQSDLARTLRRIAEQGPRAFYEGELAERIAGHLADGGAPHSLDDFAGYEATVEEAVGTQYGDAVIHSTGKATGGTTLAQSLRLLAGFDLRALDAGSADYLHLLAECFKTAFADRFAYLADPDKQESPWEALLSPDYLDARRSEIDPERATPATAGDRGALGVRHQLAASVPDYTSDGSTTHHSVIDRDGMAVSTTQTLLSLWGSGVTVPGTGVLMNNGMMWFDPEPGRPNSVGGGKKPLSNMAPAVVTRNGVALAALGASGGRRIMNCVAQLALNVIDRTTSMQEATSVPRIDRSTPSLFISPRFGEATIDELRRRGHRLTVKDERNLLGEYSSPASVRRDPDGACTGGVDPWYFPATAIGVD
jgi:gamma-glutamyltranspeptidase / glutathione hydrolase